MGVDSQEEFDEDDSSPYLPPTARQRPPSIVYPRDRSPYFGRSPPDANGDDSSSDDDDDAEADFDESQVWSVGSNVISSHTTAFSAVATSDEAIERAATSSIWRPYWNLLANNPQYRILWLGSTLSRMSDSISYITVLTLLNQLTTSGLLLSLFLLTRMLPRMILGPFLGVLVDRFDRRAFMFSCDLLRALLVLFNLFATSIDTLWVLYLVSTLQFCLMALFEPCRASLVPNTVSPSEILTANTFDGTMWSLTLAIAASAGGILINQYGTNVGFLVNAGTYFCAAMCAIPLMLDPTLSVEGLKYRAAARQHKLQSGTAAAAAAATTSTDVPLRHVHQDFTLASDLTEKPPAPTEWSSPSSDKSLPTIAGGGRDRGTTNSTWEQDRASSLTADWVALVAAADKALVAKSNLDRPDDDIESGDGDGSESDRLLGTSATAATASGKPARVSKRHMFAQGFVFVWHNPYIIALLYIKASSMFVVGGTNTLNIWLTENKYSDPEDDDGSLLGFLQTILGLSSLLGPIIARRFGRQTAVGVAVTMALAWYLLTASTSAIAVRSNLWIFFSLSAVQAAAASVLWVFSSSMLQKFAIDQYRGRILGIDLANTTLMQATGNVFAGLFLELGLSGYWACGVLAAVSAVLSLLWSVYFWLYSAHYDRPIVDPYANVVDKAPLKQPGNINA